jgi:nicotinate dehydrogenase subunit B
MTGSLHEREFSRKSFLKGGGALIVAFSLAGRALAADGPFASDGPPDVNQVDSWLAIREDNTVFVKSGRVELGQGAATGLLMITAEELGTNLDQMVHVAPDTDLTPFTGETSASSSIQHAGPAVRAAAATAHQALLGMASVRLGVPVAALEVASGVVSGGGRKVSYGELVGGKLLKLTMPSSYRLDIEPNTFFSPPDLGLRAGEAPAKPVAAYTLVGTSPPRVEIPSIVSGTYTYVHNVRVPGMLHGRRVLPRGQGLFGFGAPVLLIDESSISHIPGARVVRSRDFVGVVAPLEYHAIQAAEQLKVVWADPPAALPGNGDLFQGMRAQDAAGQSEPSIQRLSGDVGKGLASAVHVNAQTYAFPFNSLQGLGPDCAVADVTANGAIIFTGSSSLYETRDRVSGAIGLPVDAIRLVYYPSASSFGGQQARNCDVPLAAAVMSQLAGAPVRVQHMRWDDIGWATFSPGLLVDIRGGIDSAGNIVGYDTTAYYPLYKDNTDLATSELLGKPLAPSTLTGWHYPATMYEIPNERYTLKSLDPIGHLLPVQWYRAGSSPLMAFASEQMIDELAYAAKMDPVAFRRQNVFKGRREQLPSEIAEISGTLLPLMDAVTKAAKWEPRVAASNLSDANVVNGRGFAWFYDDASASAGTQAAAVADIEVNKKTGKIKVKHVYGGASSGLIVSPGLIENQISGAIVYITSRLLVEELRFTKTHVTSLDWVTYPILRFKDAPEVTPVVVQRTHLQPLGAGEPVTMAATGAIANAFFDATGVRVRQAPLTPSRVKAALRAGGSA